MTSLILAVLLALGSAVDAYADYSPDKLFVKLRSSVRSSPLDGQLSTSCPTLNNLLLSGVQGKLPFDAYATLSQPLSRIVELELAIPADLSTIALDLQNDSEVEWVAFNNRYSTFSTLDDAYEPSDELYPEAWWLQRISAGLAWEITRGDSSIVIGIIDTGVDYDHYDLAGNLWHNREEIQGNGIDDDHNGFVDDVIGWDFVDAPSLPAGSDYLERDNDPQDELGHGTYVAGCAAAVSDNGECYPSIGFNCRFMPLRAGNANGSLEEDDIAAALLYGVANGAAIINMSFGDVVASPLLREVVAVAHEAGVLMTASAGNATSDGIHYPSGFAEVIGVGATDSLDRLANFSNRGPSVDIVAPGDKIRSTMPDDSCGEWYFSSGTSYASPIVAGVAGLILSVNPELTPDDVLDILRSSADDLRTEGWDPETVGGRVNARRAVEVAAFGADAEAQIHSPGTDSGVRGSFAIIGNAQGTAFSEYSLEYGLGENPANWTFVTSGTHRILSDTLGFIQAPAIDTVLIVRLTVRATNQSQSVDMAHVYVQNSAPRIDSIRTRLVLDGAGYGQQITAWSDQFCRASLLMTNSFGDSVREDFGYVSDSHVAVISATRYTGEWQAVLQLTNLIGESVRSDPFPYSSVQSSIQPYLYHTLPTTVPHGILGEFVSDYDCDSLPEVWLLPVDANGIIDTLEPYEWNGSDLTETENTYGPHIPQCWGDADGDGLFEMAARRFGETRIWEQMVPCGVLNNIVFESSGQFTEFLIGRYVRIDTASGRDDILARINVESGKRLALFFVSDNFAVTIRDTLPNISDGANAMGAPGSAIGDLDQDGKLDFFYGDYDGDLIWVEWTGDHAEQVWTTRLRQNDATEWVAIGDFDCDGEHELVAGCRSNAGASSESERLLQGWDYYIFEGVADNELAVVDSVVILGNENTGTNPATVAAFDTDGDGCAEIHISAFPDFYVVKRDSVTGRYIPQWHYFPSKAGTVVAVDFNGNGIRDLLMSDGTQQQRIENSAAIANSPFPPILSGYPIDQTTVSLSWTHVPGAEHYELYRYDSVHGLLFMAGVVDTHYVMSGFMPDSAIQFFVATYDTAFEDPVSAFSNALTLVPNAPPSVQDTAQLVAPKTVAVRFSEPMGPSVFVQGNWRLLDGTMPAIISESEGTRTIYLAFDSPFVPGSYQLRLRNLRDAQGTPLPAIENEVYFHVDEPVAPPVYVTAHRLLDAPVGHRLLIEFSEPMAATALEVQHYTITDPRATGEYLPRLADFGNQERTSIEIEIDERFPAGAVGVEVRVHIDSIAAQSGSALEPTDLLISQSAENLDQVYAYPNPFRGIGAAGSPVVYFAALPSRAVIRIFALDGSFLREIEHDSPLGFSRWDLRTQNGDQVASGVYIYTIEADGDKKVGKIAVLR